MDRQAFRTFASIFALTFFAMRAHSDSLGPKHTGGAIYLTKKRRRHGRTYRK